MKLSQERIEYILKPILWDYRIDPSEFYQVALGKKEHVGLFNSERALLRMLERLGWYELLELFGVDILKERLTTDLISKIRIKELRHKYEFARKILQGEPVSFSGWGCDYRQRIKHTLLSNRWYRTDSALL
ncbi:hypothetical protein H8E88_27315 [candidate division KSB1 bacterium]|nr:hypothetical protein [candidate division KSB1 bacterium]